MSATQASLMFFYFCVLIPAVSSDLTNCVPLAFNSIGVYDIWAEKRISGDYSMSCSLRGDNPIYDYPLTRNGDTINTNVTTRVYCSASNDCSKIVGNYVSFEKKDIFKITAKSEYQISEGTSMRFQLVTAPYLTYFEIFCSSLDNTDVYTEIQKGHIYVSDVIFPSSGVVKLSCSIVTETGGIKQIPEITLRRVDNVPSNIDQFPPKDVLYNKTNFLSCFFRYDGDCSDITLSEHNGIRTCSCGSKSARFIFYSYPFSLPDNAMKNCLLNSERSSCVFHCQILNSSDGAPFTNKYVWRVDGVVQSEKGGTLQLNGRHTSGSVTCSTDMTDSPNVITSARIIKQDYVKFAGTFSSMSIARNANSTMECSGYINEAIKDSCEFRFYLNNENIYNSSVYMITLRSSVSGELFINTKNAPVNQTITGNYQCAIYCPDFGVLYTSENYYIVYTPEQTSAVRSSSINWSSIIAALVVLGVSFIVIVFFIYRRKCRGSSYNVHRMEKLTHGNIDPTIMNFKPLDSRKQLSGNRKLESSMASDLDSLGVYSDPPTS